MSEITIRQVEGEEAIRVSAKLRSYSFGKTPPMSNQEEEFRKTAQFFKNVIHFAVFEDDKPMAVVGSQPMTQNVRGKVLKMSGVLGVASHPLARRKGYVRKALEVLLAADRGSGMPVSGLYPFRESFYHRMGYVQFPQMWEYTLKPPEFAPAMKIQVEGDLELETIKDVYPVYRAYMQQVQEHLHGMSLFDDARAERLREDEEFWVLIARYQGEIVGMMLYQNEGFWKKTTIRNFYYTDPRGRYLLLDFLGRHADQAGEFQVRLPTPERPEQWLTDLHVKGERPFVVPMGRVLDVEGLAGINSGGGQFSATIEDVTCPWNNGHWHFAGKDGQLQVSKAESGQARLTINALSALIYGTHDPAEYVYHGWGEPTPQMIEIMRQMFPLAQPYMHEHY